MIKSRPVLAAYFEERMRIHPIKVTDERLCEGEIAVRRAHLGASARVSNVASLNADNNQW